MTNDQETIHLPMMLTAIGQSIGYGEIESAKKLQSLAMDWTKQTDRREEIYKAFAVVAGWTGTTSGLL